MNANEIWAEQLDLNTKDGVQHTMGNPIGVFGGV
jgi:hypothetical protein